MLYKSIQKWQIGCFTFSYIPLPLNLVAAPKEANEILLS